MKVAIVDFRISKEEIKSLEGLNIKVLKCPYYSGVYEAICGHPDIQINILSKSDIMVHPKINENFIKELSKLGYNVHLSSKDIGFNYPENIILNALNTEKFFLHNLTYTDKNLLNYIEDKKLLNVSQGYTKCSTAIISKEAFLTNDIKIKESLESLGADVLLLPPGDIELHPLNYGFIGGTCGLIDKNTLAFFGSLDKYIYGDKVKSFLKKHNITPFYLKESALTDRGSLFIIESKYL
ncbi:DUF6873 family GME fold protein [Clostridium algidicarnis]|uniref:DUF6873 family GME fold protein n=1 Tax=Clostridium algidicarnis TaxID=37659 RepID=UPI001C0B2429|nr:hypothetical protein [Clostridium algidicarnis]MBU3203435.1 hypothetical protein [Clostridium algidicarnis]MBU3211589.1 hypothetical protein [Clostridium algidicarnis]MBU3221903.1 hypothetical protein [Clostridium algidicarnis]